MKSRTTGERAADGSLARTEVEALSDGVDPRRLVRVSKPKFLELFSNLVGIDCLMSVRTTATMAWQ